MNSVLVRLGLVFGGFCPRVIWARRWWQLGLIYYYFFLILVRVLSKHLFWGFIRVLVMNWLGILYPMIRCLCWFDGGVCLVLHGRFQTGRGEALDRCGAIPSPNASPSSWNRTGGKVAEFPLQPNRKFLQELPVSAPPSFRPISANWIQTKINKAATSQWNCFVRNGDWWLNTFGNQRKTSYHLELKRTERWSHHVVAVRQ